MWQIYKKIPQMTEDELRFWIRYCDSCKGPWASKIQNACILRLQGETFDDYSPTREPENAQVELKWKAK